MISMKNKRMRSQNQKDGKRRRLMEKKRRRMGILGNERNGESP